MERTYDTFVDNGLFILAYYLQKDIKDITLEDIVDSVDFISDKVESFVNCEKYSGLKTMYLFNSAVANPSLIRTGVKLKDPLKEFLAQEGDEYCMICGQNHANTRMAFKGRSYLPNRPADTFFNFSNNLQGINICPYCIVLTTYAVMNARINNYVYLYNSPSDNFMKSYTKTMQSEASIDIINSAKKEKSKNYTATLVDVLRKYDEYVIKYGIEIHRFNNGKVEDVAEDEKLDSEEILFLGKLDENINSKNEVLLDEFLSLGMARIVLNKRFKNDYLGYVYDFKKKELKCSKELYDTLEKELKIVGENRLELIKKVAEKLNRSNLDIEKVSKRMERSRKLSDFEDALAYINKAYLKEMGDELVTLDEFDILTNSESWNRVRNRLRIAIDNN